MADCGLFLNCEGIGCSTYSDWTFTGLTSINAPNCKLYFYPAYHISNVTQLISCYILNDNNQVVARNNSINITSGQFVLYEENSSGITGSANWSGATTNVLTLYFSEITTTTTTLPPITTTTTTSTTTLPPKPSELKIVETVLVNPISPIVNTNGSNSNGTITFNSNSFSYGTIAPGETSETMIVFLNVPYSLSIKNIKVGLTHTGNINFDLAKFGIESLSYIDYNKIPNVYFQGVNSSKSINSIYNISIENRSDITSYYVYLNVTLPRNNEIKGGIIKYMWWFDYS